MFGSWAQVQISAVLALLVRAASVAYALPYCYSPAAHGLADQRHGYLGRERDPMPYLLALDPAIVP